MQPDHPHILRFPDRAGSAPREHYIPLRREELVDRLAADERLTPREQGTLRSFGRLLAAMLHREHHARLDELKSAYAAFDPDACNPPTYPPEEEAARREIVFTRFADMLARANFRRLTGDEIAAALAAQGRLNMRVEIDLTMFERMEIYVRGDVIGRWEKAEWNNGWKRQIVDVPLHERLALIFRLRNDRTLPRGLKPGVITLKLFKNIPHADIETVLPGPKVRMSWFDSAKIFAPTLSGFGLAAFKIFKGALGVAFTSIYGTLAVLGFVGGTLGYGVRSFFGYLNTKEKYHHNLTRSLYFQNLDNNAGVLFRILDEAEEQDFREALLAWFLLWQEAGTLGWTAERIDTAAEERLREWLQQDIDFEIHDALDKLKRFGIVEATVGDRWRATPLPIALLRLERAWNDLNPIREHDVRMQGGVG